MSSKLIGRIIAGIAPPLVVLAQSVPEQWRAYVLFGASVLGVIGGALGWSAPADTAELQFARDSHAPLSERRS